MPIIEWNDQYSIGVEKIDNHHKHFFLLLNKIYDSFLKHVPNDELDSLLRQLIEYSMFHFSAEERLMQENLFPGLDAHKREHDGFSEKVIEMQKDYLYGDKALCLAVISFLNNWVSNHILQVDAGIGHFLAAKDIELQ